MHTFADESDYKKPGARLFKQLFDAIKNIGYYQEFIALPILIQCCQNSAGTNPGIDIVASLVGLHTLPLCVILPLWRPIW